MWVQMDQMQFKRYSPREIAAKLTHEDLLQIAHRANRSLLKSTCRNGCKNSDLPRYSRLDGYAKAMISMK